MSFGSEPLGRSATGQWIVPALFAAVLATMGLHYLVYARYALTAVQSPIGLDYGEGVVWQQAILIPGPRMYGDIDRFPFIVFNYAPLFHLLVHGAIALGLNGLVAGRSLSLLATQCVGVLVGAISYDAAIARHGRLASLLGAAIGGSSVFCMWPLVAWSPMLRTDMLAIAFSFLGVWAALRATRRPALLYVAVLAFVLAVWTKQNSLAAPLATLPVMLLAHGRRAWLACGFGLALSVAALLAMELATGGGFLRHILLYNINRFNADAIYIILYEQRRHVIFLFLAVAALVLGWHDLSRSSGWRELPALIRRDQHARMLAVLALYFLATTVMLVALGKSGASINYMIEWMCVWSVLIGLLVAGLVAPALNGVPRVISPLLPVVALALVAQVALVPATADFRLPDAAGTRRMAELEERVRNADRPVLSDDIVLLLKAGKTMPYEPAMFAELASTGRWDEPRILAMIEARDFAFVITQGQRGEAEHDERYTPAVDAAIAAAYPRTEAYPGRILRLPP